MPHLLSRILSLSIKRTGTRLLRHGYGCGCSLPMAWCVAMTEGGGLSWSLVPKINGPSSGRPSFDGSSGGGRRASSQFGQYCAIFVTTCVDFQEFVPAQLSSPPVAWPFAVSLSALSGRIPSNLLQFINLHQRQSLYRLPICTRQWCLGA